MSMHYTLETLIKFNEFNIKVEHSTIYKDLQSTHIPFLRWLWIVSGFANHIVGEYSYPIKAGDMFVIKGELSHGFNDVNSLELINLMYDNSLLSYTTDELRAIPGFEPLFLIEPEVRYMSEYRHMLSLSNKDINYIINMTTLIIELFKNKTTCHEIVIKTSFLALIAYLSSQYPI